MYQKKQSGRSYYTGRHSCFLLQYHIVLVTKYRHPVITGKVKEDLYRMVEEHMKERGYTLLEMNGEADHVHILFEADPYTRVGEVVNAVKTRTSRLLRKQYGDNVLKPYYWKPYFWACSYFAATVSEQSLTAVEDYIRNQKG